MGSRSEGWTEYCVSCDCSHSSKLYIEGDLPEWMLQIIAAVAHPLQITRNTKSTPKECILTELAALLGGMSRRCNSGNRSSAICPPHGPIGADPDSNQMVKVGATIKSQPEKANVVADALSRSQRKGVKDSMDDPVAAAAAIEEQVSTLRGFSVELTEEGLQKWAKAYCNACADCTYALPFNAE